MAHCGALLFAARLLLLLSLVLPTDAAGAVVARFRGLTTGDDAAPFASRGCWMVNVAPDGVTFSGQLRLGRNAWALHGAFDGNGTAIFRSSGIGSRSIDRPGHPTATLTFSRTFTDGVPQLTGLVEEQGAGGASIQLTAGAALYVAAANPTAPLVQTPTELVGRYTVVFPPRTPVQQGLDAEDFPQGYGVATLTVRTNGQAVLVGRLGDGSAISCTAPITAGNAWPLYVGLMGREGAILGPVQFRDQPNVSDLDATELAWFQPARLTGVRYPQGWPSGIKVDLLGSHYIASGGAFPDLGTPGTQGNARFKLRAGTLGDADASDGDPATPITRSANVRTDNTVTVISPGATQLGCKIDRVTGTFTGTFRHNLTGALITYRGAVLQKQEKGFGYFLSTAP